MSRSLRLAQWQSLSLVHVLSSLALAGHSWEGGEREGDTHLRRLGLKIFGDFENFHVSWTHAYTRQQQPPFPGA